MSTLIILGKVPVIPDCKRRDPVRGHFLDFRPQLSIRHYSRVITAEAVFVPCFDYGLIVEVTTTIFIDQVAVEIPILLRSLFWSKEVAP